MQTTELTVAHNVRRFRELRRHTVRSLSAVLGELGRPILPSGISKIEDASRRVDVGDLVALAIALRVSPVALLLPGDMQPVDLAPAARTGWRAAWLWATGETPLTVEGGDRVDLFSSDTAECIRVNRPFERDPVDEMGRFLMARLSGKPFDAEVHHDGTGRISGSVTISGGGDGER